MSARKKRERLWLPLVAADLFALAAAYYTTFLIRFRSAWGERLSAVASGALGGREAGLSDYGFEAFYLASAFRIIVLLMLVVSVLYALRDLHAGRRFLLPRPLAWNVLAANLTALALFYVYFYMRRNVFHPRSFFAGVLLLNVVYCVLFRRGMDWLLRSSRARDGARACRAVLIGAGREADSIHELIDRRHPHGIHVACRIASLGERPFETVLAELSREARAHQADMVISADSDLSVVQIMELLALSDELNLSAKILSDKMDILMSGAKLAVDVVQGTPLVHFEAPSNVRSGKFARAFARAWATAAWVLLLPFVGLIAAAIRLTSRGPALFEQERIGVNRRPFIMYKFRTMTDRAQELQAQVEEFNESGGGLFKIKEDPRVTPIGRLLRRLSLDELPQLINVIKGEMTVVGPRPLPRRDFENYYEDWHYSRHSGMPGLTCLWQVSGRSHIAFHDMCILDVYYLRNQNWIMDIGIVLRTVKAVVFGTGAY